MRPRVCLESACVAVPCLVGGAGIRLTHVAELPRRCAALDRMYLNVVELTVRPALEEQSEHVPQTMLVDPSCSSSVSTSQTEQRYAESLAAKSECIPAKLAAGMGHSPAGSAERA
jgi:alpha-galactosidase